MRCLLAVKISSFELMWVKIVVGCRCKVALVACARLTFRELAGIGQAGIYFAVEIIDRLSHSEH